jgi:hypothetical protein
VSTTFGKEDEIIVVCILGFETFRMLFTTTFLNVLKLSPVNSRDAKVARDPSWQHLNSALLVLLLSPTSPVDFLPGRRMNSQPTSDVGLKDFLRF